MLVGPSVSTGLGDFPTSILDLDSYPLDLSQDVCSGHAASIASIDVLFLISCPYISSKYRFLQRWTLCAAVQEILDRVVFIDVSKGKGSGN